MSTIDETAAAIKASNAVKDQNVNEPVDAVTVTESDAVVKARAAFHKAYARLVETVTAENTPDGLTADAVAKIAFVQESAELHSFLYTIDAETRLRAVNAFRVLKTDNRNLCILRSAGVEFPIRQSTGGNWSADAVSVNLYDKYGTLTDVAKYTPKQSTNSNPDLGYFKKNICMAGGRMGLECADMAHTEHKAKVLAETVKRAPKAGALTADAVTAIAQAAVAQYIAAMESAK